MKKQYLALSLLTPVLCSALTAEARENSYGHTFTFASQLTKFFTSKLRINRH